MTPPGTRALAFASRWFDPATVHRTFEPLIADWQREWHEATPGRRVAIQIKGVAAFVMAMIVSVPEIVRVRAPKSLTDQIARRVAIGAAIGTVILMWPFVSYVDMSLWDRSVIMLTVIPQALTLAFPFALVPAVDAIRRFEGLDSHTARAAVSKLAVLGVVFVFFCHGWVTPAANQLFRELSSAALIRAQGDTEAIKHFERRRSGPARGVREMSNSELLTTFLGADEREPGTISYANATSMQKEINNRAAIAVLPIVLLWRRWRSLDLPAGRRLSARHSAIATIALIVAFGAFTPLGQAVQQAWHLPAGSGSWLTLAFLAMTGMTRVWLVERSVARA